jgi:hypothetical protein
MRKRSLQFLALAILGALTLGCDDGPAVAPVAGKVLYNGQPMPYGSILFQPRSGQPAGGAIQPDGTFKLSTFQEFDGAIVGSHKVSVSCYTSQSPSQKEKKTVGEATIGALLIPSQFTFADQSGLSAEVPAEGTDSLVFELTGPPAKFPN